LNWFSSILCGYSGDGWSEDGWGRAVTGAVLPHGANAKEAQSPKQLSPRSFIIKTKKAKGQRPK